MIKCLIIAVMLKAVFDLRQLRNRGFIHRDRLEVNQEKCKVLAQGDNWHKYKLRCGYKATSEIVDLCRYFGEGGGFAAHCEIIGIENPQMLLAGLMRAPEGDMVKLAIAA